MTKIQIIRRLVLLVAIGLAGVAFAVHQSRQQPAASLTQATAEPGKSAIGGELALTGTDGKPFDTAALKGKLRLVFFGYTFCPDACPTDLLRAGQVLDALGKDADKLAYVFVSVDPARDTPARIKEFLQDFDPRIIGLTGTEEQVKAAMEKYRVFARKHDETDKQYYLVDHAVLLYFLDGDAEFLRVFRPAETADDLVKAIRAELAKE